MRFTTNFPNSDCAERTESQVDNLFGAETLGVVRIAPEGHFTNVNPAFSRMLGFEKAQLLRKKWDEVTHPHDVTHEIELLKTITEGSETSYKIEKRYLRGNGLSLWVTETSSAVNDAKKNLLYRISLVQINPSKQAAEHFRSALEAAENAMLLLDPKGRIELSNTSFEHLLGHHREAFLGKSISVLADSTYRKVRFETLLRCAVNEIHPPKIELCFRTESGLGIRADVCLAPMYAPGGIWILMSLLNIKRVQRRGRKSLITIPLFERGEFPAHPRRVLDALSSEAPAYGLRRASNKNH